MDILFIAGFIIVMVLFDLMPGLKNQKQKKNKTLYIVLFGLAVTALLLYYVFSLNPGSPNELIYKLLKAVFKDI